MTETALGALLTTNGLPPLLRESAQAKTGSQFFSIHGRIKYRFLINYRISPALLSQFDLGPLKFDFHRGEAFLSVCVLRLQLRPGFSPLAFPWSTEILYRLAVKKPDEERAFLSLLSLNSNRVIAALGSRFAPFRFRHEPMDLQEDGQLVQSGISRGASSFVEIRSRGHHLQGSLAALPGAPAGSMFDSPGEAQRFFLELEGGVSRRGLDLYEQRIDRSGWGAEFCECQFESALIDSWTRRGDLEYDSSLVMSELEQTWHRMRACK